MASGLQQPAQPNKPVAPTSTEASEVVPSQAIPLPEIISLPRGKELSDSAALALAKSRPMRWIVVAGPVGSGKTTLLTSLYELFQWNKVPNYMFAGSETLPAFEERCYLSRTASENTEADTARTIYDPIPTYLHLGVSSTAWPRRFAEFLITDVSGEMFEQARDSTTACKQLTFLRRARQFLVLLDSKRSLLLEKRWVVIHEAKTLLQSCLDSKMLADDCAVRVIWSRFDYFVQAGNAAEHRTFRDEVVAEFRNTFGNRIADLRFAEIAARPTKAPQLGFGNGVVTLFEEWIKDYPRTREMSLMPEFAGTRESELFGRRQFGMDNEI